MTDPPMEIISANSRRRESREIPTDYDVVILALQRRIALGSKKAMTVAEGKEYRTLGDIVETILKG